jgi:two-component system NarL family response regulator
MSIRVLIADDHPLVRDGLRFSIERSRRDIEIVGEAANGVEVLQMAEKFPTDIFILDITMPRLNGLDTARELIRQRPGVKVIILSFHDARTFVEEAMKVGARGYLTKETASRNIVEAISEVHLGRLYLSPDVSHHMTGRVGRGADDNGTGQSSGTLTLQERKILQLIAEGRTAKEIAAELGRAVNTVNAHRKNMMAKLDLHKQTELVRFAVREGIAKL